MHIQKIQDEGGHWREGEGEIAKAAINYFQKVFNHRIVPNDFFALNFITPKLSDEDNEMLIAMVTLEEIKEVSSP